MSLFQISHILPIHKSLNQMLSIFNGMKMHKEILYKTTFKNMFLKCQTFVDN